MLFFYALFGLCVLSAAIGSDYGASRGAMVLGVGLILLAGAAGAVRCARRDRQEPIGGILRDELRR